jgi:hypothetical protein
LTRLSIVAFGALVIATVGAFFITQHLKVTTPLIAGTPAPVPSWINPVDGSSCWVSGPKGKRELVNFRSSTVSFYLLHRADYVDVSIVDQAGDPVAKIASARYMPPKERVAFTWDGREADGQVAPDGRYYIHLYLTAQQRAFNIAANGGQSLPITVRTVPPQPVITSLTPTAGPGGSNFAIDYTGNEHRGGTILIYSADRGARPRLVKTFPTPWSGQSVVWNGRIDQRPAAPGTYLIGLQVTDAACNTGTSALHEVSITGS